MATPRVPLIFGTMTFGEEGKSAVRTTDKADCQRILDVFVQHGGKEIDSARVYGEGTTEAYLSTLDLHGVEVDTKAHPYEAGAHDAKRLRASVETSLATLGQNVKIRTLYLHWPDRATPFDETLATLDALHKEGKFAQLGLSNFAAWEVAQVCTIARERGWVQPTVYQAMYNGLTRAIEEELVPCLHKFGLRLVVYNPLAGGLLTGKVAASTTTLEPNSRFDVSSTASSAMAKMYQKRYFRSAYFEAVDLVRQAAEQNGLTMVEVALRWMQHHSALTETDGVIIGASSAQQLESNSKDSAKGPLPASVVEAMDQAWLKVKGQGPLYWR